MLQLLVIHLIITIHSYLHPLRFQKVTTVGKYIDTRKSIQITNQPNVKNYRVNFNGRCLNALASNQLISYCVFWLRGIHLRPPRSHVTLKRTPNKTPGE